MRLNKAVLILAMVLGIACRRKAELLPQGAHNVKRSDVVSNNGPTVRRYTFDLSLAKGRVNFLCESRIFADSVAARSVAEQSIAQRPDEEQRKASAWYARAGLSQWLWAHEIFTWCMPASGPPALRQEAVLKLRETMLQKFQEA
ncbi:MAG: hypothetical protein N2Z22_02265 [Turneriella sp.]|nr:hypothetical protein [Turneriella sp.]